MGLKRLGLAERRKVVGLSQEQLAWLLEVDRTTVVRWECAETTPIPRLRPRLAEALRVTDEELAELLSGVIGGQDGLAARRRRSGHTQESLAEVLGVAVSTVADWEQGSARPLPALRRPLADVLSVSLDELDRLLGGDDEEPGGDSASADPLAHNENTPREEDDLTKRRDALRLGLAVATVPGLLSRVLQESAGEVAEFTRAARAGVARGTFDHLHAVVSEFDRSYSGGLPAEQFVVARAYRAWVQQLIEGRHTLEEGRELYVYAAWLDELLASLANELGDPLAAEAYAVDCLAHADQVGHDELCAWAADVMTSIATYAHRPAQAVAAARRGIARAPTSHPIAVRLRAKAARAHAQLGQREECEDLIAEANGLYEQLPAQSPTRCIVDAGSVLPAYSASSYIWLGDFGRARRHAEEAVAVHEVTPVGSRSPVTEALARIDLAIALAELGSPDEAVGQGLLALASPRLVKPVLVRAGDLDATIASRYPGLPEARHLHERLSSHLSGGAGPE
jgi:transcriptional regulator with XRE-family HTH domain